MEDHLLLGRQPMTDLINYPALSDTDEAIWSSSVHPIPSFHITILNLSNQSPDEQADLNYRSASSSTAW
jgi:hypothetical protein